MTARRRPALDELSGLADQALASGVNFLTLLVLARALGPAGFGYFVLAFALLQSANALQSALITRAHNVLGAGRVGAGYAAYTTATALAQVAFASALALVLAAGAGIAWAAGAAPAVVFLAASPALLAWQLQEFGRRVLYTEGRLRAALANDAVAYGSQAAVLLVLWQGHALTGPRAFYLVAATSGAAVVLAAWQLRSSFARVAARDAYRANWSFGKWLGAAEIAYWVSSQSYLYVAGAVVGSAASGALKASQTLLGPISVFLAFFVTFLPIKFARALRASGASVLAGELRAGLLRTVPAAAAYGAAVAVFAQPLLVHLYGGAYGRYAGAVRLFAVYYVLLAVSDVVVASLSARGLTQRIFVGHACGALLSLAVGWPLLKAAGTSGAVAGMIASLLVSFGVFLSAHRAASRHAGTRRSGRRGRSCAFETPHSIAADPPHAHDLRGAQAQ